MKRLIVIIAAFALSAAVAAAGRAPRAAAPAKDGPRASKAVLDTVFFDNFESDTLVWTTMDVLVQQPYWHIDEHNAYIGSSWWCGTFDPSFITNPGYGDAWVQYLHTPNVDLTAVTSDTVLLNFMHYYSIEAASGGSDWDCINLWASTDGGASWTVLFPDESRGTPAYNLTNATGWHYCGLAPATEHIPGWGGSNGSWQQAWFDLTQFRGEAIVLRFATVSDGAESDQASSYGGAWFIDEIRVDTVSAGGNAASLFYDDVESGANGWTTHVKTPAIHWHRSSNRSSSPTRSWYCGDSLTYKQSWGYSDAIISPVIDLRDVKPSFPCVATFSQWVDLRDGNNGYIRGWDYYDVEVSGDSGVTWDYVDQYVQSTPQLAWTAGPSISLSSYVGGSVMVRLTMNTDEDDTTGEGVYIDNFIVTGKGKDPLPGPATVLLVDNDQDAVDLSDNSWTKYFEASLAALGFRYSSATIGANKPIYPGYLDQFPAVVWNLGARYQPMVDADLDNIMAYLDGGGRLWLSGQYFLSSSPDTTAHPNLWTDYLHLSPANGWYPAATNAVTGCWGDVIGDGLAEALSYGRLNGGNVYWTDAWHAYALNPDTPAVAVVGFAKNDDSTLCGLRYDAGGTGGYRMVYTSFPFEAIDNVDARDTLMARILSWLLPQPPDNEAPAAPQGLAAVQEYDSVVCRWSANSEADLAGYRVYRSLQQGLPVWQRIGVVAAPETTFVDTTIAPAVIYHYTVSAYDGAQPANESAWAPWLFLQTGAWAKLGMEGADAAGLPRSYGLAQCRPNPVRDHCRIEFALPRPGRVSLAVYNIAGQKVRTLADREFGAGYHGVTWDGADQHGRRAAAGVYLYRLEAPAGSGTGFSQTRRLMVVK